MRLAGSLFVIPSDALAPELVFDYHERTTLISYRWFFGLFGALAMGFVLGFVFLRQDKSHPLGQYDPAAYANFGAIAAAIVAVFVAILASSMATHRYIKVLSASFAGSDARAAAQTFREIAQVLTNPSLLAIMASGLISGVAGGISSTLGDFMNYNFWGLTPADTRRSWGSSACQGHAGRR